MPYFVLYGSEDGGRIREITEQEIEEVAKEVSEQRGEFLPKIPSSDFNYWGEGNKLIIKGEIIVPNIEEDLICKNPLYSKLIDLNWSRHVAYDAVKNYLKTGDPLSAAVFATGCDRTIIELQDNIKEAIK